MEKKLFGAVLLLVLGGVAGCATAPATLVSRGTVASAVAGNRAVVAGPRTVHAYSGFGGGELFNARATSGTDADCDAANQTGATVLLPADKVVLVSVSAGQVACLRTRVDHRYELLWHATDERPGAQLLASADHRGRL